MNITLILTIAVGVIIGGLVLVHRDWIGRQSLALTLLLARAIARGAYVARWYIGACIVVSAFVLWFAMTRPEHSPGQWWANQLVKSAFIGHCQDKGGTYSSGDGNYFYCFERAYTKDVKLRWSWAYSRSGCRLTTYNYPDMSAATEHYTEPLCKDAR